MSGGPVADWRLGLETVRVEAQCRRPCEGERLNGPQHYAKSAASLGVLPVRVGDRGSRAGWITVKATDAVKNLDVQPPRTLRPDHRDRPREARTSRGPYQLRPRVSRRFQRASRNSRRVPAGRSTQGAGRSAPQPNGAGRFARTLIRVSVFQRLTAAS